MHGEVYIGEAVNWESSLNRGLVSWWRALPGQQRGNVFRDLCLRNHGTLTNAPLWTGALGRPGGHGALSFDASDDRVQLGTQFSVADGVTHAAWIYPTVLNANQAIRANKKTIWTTASGSMMRWFPDSDTTTVDDNVNAVALNSWWHVAITQVGTTYAFYTNGKPGRTGTTVALDDASDAATIGSFKTAFLWPGYLDDIRDYSRALSASEIAALYDDSSRGNPTTLNYIRPATVFDLGGGGGGGTILPQLLQNGLFVNYGGHAA